MYIYLSEISKIETRCSNIRKSNIHQNVVKHMLLRAFAVCWTALFIVLVGLRALSVVSFEISYDELALMGLGFGVGMLFMDFAKRC